MESDETVTLVDRKVGEEKEFAEQVAENLKQRKIPIRNHHIENFFPELTQAKEEGRIDSWGNLPRIPMQQYLLVGQPAVFDLEPLEEQEFINKHKISIKTAEELADRMILLPNIYWRDPTKWKGKRHLAGLIEKARVNGERVDQYLQTRNQNYSNQFDEHKQQLDNIWISLDKTDRQILATSIGHKFYDDERDDTTLVVAKWWSYYDTLSPQIANNIENLIQNKNYIEAARYALAMIYSTASPITAALGGEFTWGPKELQRIDSKNTQPFLELAQKILQCSEAIEYIIREINRVPPLYIQEDWEETPLLRVIKNPNLSAIKSEIHKTIDVLMRLGREGGNPDPTIKDFKRLTQEWQKQLDAYRENTSNAILGIGGIIGATVGGVTGMGIVESIGSVAAGIFFTQLISKEKRDQLGSYAYQFSPVNRDKHRILLTLKQLKEMSQDE